jgi:hypothetical protein
MRTITAAWMLAGFLAMGFLLLLVGASRAQGDWQALGKSGTAAGSVSRVGLPRTDIMHFWAHNDALKLSAGLEAALAHINIAKS